MASRSDNLKAAINPHGSVRVLLSYAVMKDGQSTNHVKVLELNISAVFMQWFIQEFKDATPFTDVIIHVEDLKYTVYYGRKNHVIANVKVSKTNVAQRELDHEQYPEVPLYRKLTGFTEIKDYAMPNLRTEWMKLHS